MTTADLTLSYEAAPAFSAPLRFFLTAPLFGIAAGLLLLVSPDLLASRWTPGALALTHLIAVGFMLNVMFGALFQILPVVAGAVLPNPRIASTLVHVGLTAGGASLAWGLGAGAPNFLVVAALLLGGTFVAFLLATGYGLLRAPVAQATPRDLRVALIGFAVAGTLGVLLALTLARGLAIPLLTVVKLHVGWAWLGAAGVLLAATSWVVVPMFQITPNYPEKLTRYWAGAIGVTLALWSAAAYAEIVWAEQVLLAGLAALSVAFAGTTLWLQKQSRRSVPDNTTRSFQLAMASLLGGLLCVLLAQWLDHEALPVLAGVLILYGGFVSAIFGMLYKIVPFLAWLHLSQAKLKAPNMKKLLPDRLVRRSVIAHAVAFGLLLLATLTGSALLGRAAGIAVVVAFAILFANLLKVLGAYRQVKSV